MNVNVLTCYNLYLFNKVGLSIIWVITLGNMASSSAEPRMTSLEAQVGALSAQLEEQVKLNRQLQQQLSQVLSQCAELTLSLP